MTKEITKSLIEEYSSQLSDKEKVVLKIATEHLESSFTIEKSIGFEQWLKEKNTE